MTGTNEEPGRSRNCTDHWHSVRGARAIPRPFGHLCSLLNAFDVALRTRWQHIKPVAHPWSSERLNLQRARQTKLLMHRRDGNERFVQDASGEGQLRNALILQVISARALHGNIKTHITGERVAPHTSSNDDR